MDLRLKNLLCPKIYVWVDVLLIKETKKAILIEFDYRKAWFPKVRIARIKRNKRYDRLISIKISEYCWTKKFHL